MKLFELMDCFRKSLIITVFFLLLCCLGSMAQDYKKMTKEILGSKLEEKEKIDSLFLFSLKYYYKDIQYFTELSESLHNQSNNLDYKLGSAQSLILKSLLANEQGDLSNMYAHTEKALSIIPKDPATLELCLALYSKGNYLRLKKRDKEAFEVLIQGLKVAEILNNTRMASSFNNLLGIMYVGREEYGKALKHYDEVFELARSINDSVKMQQMYTNKGIVFLRLQRYEDAIASHHKALDLAQKLNSRPDEAFVYNDLGATYVKSNTHIPKAIDYLKKSIKIREQLNLKSEIAYTYSYLGEAYALLGDKEQSISNLSKALQIARKIGDRKQEYQVLKQLAVQHQRFRNFESAYLYLNSYVDLQDSIRKTEQAETIEALLVQFETERKEQEISILKQKNQISELAVRQRNLYLILALLLLVAALCTLWLLNRNKKLKENRLKQEAHFKEELLILEAKNSIQNDRLRISRDLHDNIGANLTFIQATLDENKKLNEQKQDLQELVAETITELRRTVWLINKSSVSLEEWLIKLRDYYKKIPKVGIQSDLNEVDFELSSVEATSLFRIIQEAVNNALKHASAENIQIHIDNTKSKLHIAIKDNGVGFTNENSEGFGLGNMQQHAVTIGAKFSWSSTINEGTTIAVIWDKHT
jgi:signal transduction histidine kinase